MNNPPFFADFVPPKFNDRLQLGIMAKAPLPGRVKTRLSPPLSPEECAEFQRLAFLATVAAMRPFATTIFHCGAVDSFAELAPGLPLIPQGEGDLGDRIFRALNRLLHNGAERAVLIGSDSPDLPPQLVAKLFTALEGTDAAAIPAQDGGYVAIGIRNRVPRELFREMPWSTPHLLEETRRRAAGSALRWQEVGGWEDVDAWDDLLRLAERMPDSEIGRFVAPLRGRYPSAD